MSVKGPTADRPIDVKEWSDRPHMHSLQLQTVTSTVHNEWTYTSLLLQYQLCRSSLVANEGKVGIMAPLCFQRYYGRAVSHCDKYRLCQDDFDKSTTPEGNAQSFWKLTHPGNGVLTFVISSWSRFYRQNLSVKCIVGASKTWINVPGILHCPRSI